jgi:hypothetical protein
MTSAATTQNGACSPSATTTAIAVLALALTAADHATTDATCSR